MVHITRVFQYNFKTELMKVKIVHNEINGITKEKALMAIIERMVTVFSEISCWYKFKARWCIDWFRITASTLDWLDKYIWYNLNWVSNRGLRPREVYLGSMAQTAITWSDKSQHPTSHISFINPLDKEFHLKWVNELIRSY